MTRQNGIENPGPEQLGLSLSRAGSLPLDLIVDWPTDTHKLNLIASVNNPIGALSITDRIDESCTVNSFKNLNLGSLRELSLDMPVHKIPAFMELALKSSQNQLSLQLKGALPTNDVLAHGLMNRVTRFSIQTS
jgi:hypothetical protein